MNEIRQILDKSIVRELQVDNLAGLCELISFFIKTELNDNKTMMAKSAHPYSEGHIYLVKDMDIEPEEQIIIDGSISQFLKGYNDYFIGTRADLKKLVNSGKYEIMNTFGNYNPSETFERIWGDYSKEHK